jgi:hypothetical protein
MRTTESSASVGGDVTQDNNETLNVSFDSILPLQDAGNDQRLSENIDAELDEDNDVDINDTTNSIMAIFLKAVHRELKEQVRGRAAKEPWLLAMLKAPGADWWLRAGQARLVCKKLDIVYDEPAYYRDIHVWLPDVRWGAEAMPPCVICKSAEEVSPHDFLTNHFGRRVCALTTNYFIVTQRYICGCCKRRACNTRLAIDAVADAVGLSVEEATIKTQYTFMGYDPRSRIHLPFGYGDEYPAFHTFKGAIDLSIIDLMRPLFNKGVRPAALSDILLELHAKQYTRDYLKREQHLARDSRLGIKALTEKTMFSSFGNKYGYAGLVPTGNYLSHVYKLFAASIEDHLEKEVKKRGAERLHWDASYKEAKHLGQYHGESIFRALITATNHVGEIRVQFHVVTDGHDQMTNQIETLLETLRAYGHEMPQLLTTDKPMEDKAFFQGAIPSLKIKQRELDDFCQLTTSTALPLLNECTVDPSTIKICRTTLEINTNVDAARNLVRDQLLECRVMSLDTEWDVHKNAGGYIVGQGTVALIQLSFRIASDGPIHVLLLQVYNKKTLPDRLLELLTDTSITFVGRAIAGDMAKIGRDFSNASNIKQIVKTLDLGIMARARDVVQSGTVGLECLVERVLNEKLSKVPSVRLSRWSVSQLSDEQINYSALDVIKALEVFFKLNDMPDLTSRLTLHEATPGRVVDIVPSHGNVHLLATRAAISYIEPWCEEWMAPNNCRPAKLRLTSGQCLVTITNVLAPKLVVPKIKSSSGERMTLGDFGVPPFQVVLPIGMMKPHIDSDSIRITNIADHTNNQATMNTANNQANRTTTNNQANTNNANNQANLSQTNNQANGNTTNNQATMNNANNQANLSQTNNQANRNNANNQANLSQTNNQANVNATNNQANVNATNNQANMSVANTATNNQAEDDDDSIQGEESNQSCEDEDVSNLTSNEISTVRAAMVAGTTNTMSALVASMLDEAPTTIEDRFSSVVGDSFHFMDRPKVPMHHDGKKGYFVALRQAWFQWDPTKLAEVKATLRYERGMNNNEIEALMYYYVDYFCVRVPRVVLPPSKLYWRVRAVYETYGPMIDAKTKAPLFNKAAWKKANNVLKEILAGNASDPCGMVFYSQQLNAKGEPAFDYHDHAMLDCSRGSNDTECAHKQFITTFGTWNTGVQMSDVLMAEWRHRYNQHVSERRRLGFPRIGHYDTWLIDYLQIIVERNHGVLLYPDWSNASDYETTCERFGTVAIHSQELADAIQNIELDKELSNYRLTADQQYLCKTMNTKLPLLPVVGKEENQLFERLVLAAPQGPINFDQMAIEWCKNVDAVNIFPKLPVYLRTHYSKWQRNQRVRDAVDRAAPGEARLREINAGFGIQSAGTVGTGTPPEATMVPVILPPTLQQPPGTLLQPVVGVVVGGTMVGGAPPTRGVEGKKTRGQRGKDGVGIVRHKRCKYCTQHGKSFEEASICPGRGTWSMCTGGESGISLECMICNSITKCRCPMPKKT